MEILVRMLSVLLALSFLVSYSATSCPPVSGKLVFPYSLIFKLCRYLLNV